MGMEEFKYWHGGGVYVCARAWRRSVCMCMGVEEESVYVHGRGGGVYRT
jgi:hypothetical protein